MEDRASILRDMKICRFCLTETEPLKNIYDRDKNNAVPLPLQIMACVALEVFANDGMPQLICENCCEQTLKSYNFKTLCKRSDDALKLFLATGVLKRGNEEIPITSSKRSHSKEQEKVETPPKRKKSNEKSPEKNEVIKVSTEESAEIVLSTEKSSEDVQIKTLTEEIQEEEIPQVTEIEIQDDGNCNIKVIGDNDETQLLFEEAPKFVSTPKVVQTHCFPCDHCDRSFPLQQLLEIHMRNHTRERKFACKECDKKFFSKHDLNKHSLTHSAAKPFTCVVCDKSFSRITLLHRHEKIHVQVPKYLCTYCDRTFLTSESLDSHMKDHKKNRPFQCRRCDKKFAFKQGLERHEVSHVNENAFKCNYCSESFSTSSKLQRHITSHAGNRPYPCKMCPRTFVLSHHLTRHMKSHYVKKSEDTGDFKCDVCSMSFKKKYLLINHSAIHSMVNLKCVICNKQFEDAQTVKEHITTHLGGFPFECYQCEYSFETEDELLEHEQKHDDENQETDEFEISQERPRRSMRQKRAKTYSDFLKPEDLSDSDENIEETNSNSDDDDYIKETSFQPVMRNESLKTYKGNREKTQTAQSTQQKTPQKNLKITTLENLGISQSTLDSMNLDKSNFVEMKIGQKIIRVQKLTMTKAEVEAISEQGKLNLKGCKVLVKNSSDNIDLNKLIKSDETSSKNVKTYVKKKREESEEQEDENKTETSTNKSDANEVE